MSAIISSAAWFIGFKTDVIKAAAPVIPLGVMLEAEWSGQGTWLGMLFRKQLTPNEHRQVDISTWPELADVETTLGDLFDQAWEKKGNLGSAKIAASYPAYSALHFKPINGFEVPAEFGYSSFANLYQTLIEFDSFLKPVLAAEVIEFKSNKPNGATSIPFEVVLKAA